MAAIKIALHKVVVVMLLLSTSASSGVGMNYSLSHFQPYDTHLECSPGFIHNDILNTCECYPSINVKCNGDEAILRFGRCLTYKEGEGTFLGLCISFRVHDRNVTDAVYIRLPRNNTELNDYICGPMNRKGLACRECIDGFSPALTSFGYQCSNCSDAWYGVPLFLFLEFVPITIFYIFVLLSRISITTAPMSSFILFSQLAAHVFTIFVNLTAAIENEHGSTISFFIKLATSLYGIWNLDFFRYVIPPFCISPHLRLYHVFILYYISAFYPLVLIFITWICIQLHSQNKIKPLSWLWNQLKRTCCCVHTGEESKNTIVDVFAAFFLLSYTKLAYSSLYFLLYNNITKNGQNFLVVSAIDHGIEYFNRSHAPIAIFALIIFCGPTVIPVIILSLFPVKAFRSLQQKLKISGHSRAALNHFVERFLSCYKDGLQGGKDMRSFVCLPFLLRLSVFVGFILQSEFLFWVFHFLLFGMCSLFIALVQPYKMLYMNVTDAIILALLSLLGIFYILYLLTDSNVRNIFSVYTLFALYFTFILPLLGCFAYNIARITYKRIPTSWKLWLTTTCCTNSSVTVVAARQENHLQAINQQAQQTPSNGVTTTDLELPDRLVNPCRYEEAINEY